MWILNNMCFSLSLLPPPENKLDLESGDFSVSSSLKYWYFGFSHLVRVWGSGLWNCWDGELSLGLENFERGERRKEQLEDLRLKYED